MENSLWAVVYFLLLCTYQTMIYWFLYCCFYEGVLAVCTAILDLCYLKYLLWFDVLDPKEILPVPLFHGERLRITENT